MLDLFIKMTLICLANKWIWPTNTPVGINSIITFQHKVEFSLRPPQLQFQPQGVLIACSTNEKAHAFPCLSMRKANSVVDNPAAKLAFPAFPTSACTAKQAKTIMQTCIQDVGRVMCCRIYWLHLWDLSGLRLCESGKTR